MDSFYSKCFVTCALTTLASLVFLLTWLQLTVQSVIDFYGTLLPNDTQGTIYTFSKIKKIPMVSWVLIIAELCLTLLCLISSKGQNKTYSHICCTNKKFPILFLVFCHWYDTECPSFSQLFQSLQACPHHISSKDLNTVINMASPKSMRNHMQHQECHLQC